MGLGRRFWRSDAKPGREPRRASSAHEGWLRRQARGRWPDRNPLRRRTDRVETYLLAGLFVAAAAGAPFAAQAASHSAYASALRAQQEQLATRHQVKAVLTTPAGTTASGYSITSNVLTGASWTSAAGTPRSGEILAREGSPKGTAVTVWIDEDGNLASPPLLAAQVTEQGQVAAGGAIAGVAIVFLTGAGFVRYALHRRRMAAWEADWQVTAPTWNHQSW